MLEETENKELLEGKYFLTVCRLDENQKDVTTLIKAYSKYEGEKKFYIIGDGPDKKVLEKLNVISNKKYDKELIKESLKRFEEKEIIKK